MPIAKQRDLPMEMPIPLQMRARFLVRLGNWFERRWLPITLSSLAVIVGLPIVHGYLRKSMLDAATECRALGYDGVRDLQEPFSCSISYLNTKGTTSTLTVGMSGGLAVEMSHTVKVLRDARDAGVKLPDMEISSLEGLDDKWQKAL